MTRAKGKGFGELLQKKRNGFGDGETEVDAEVEKPEEVRPCPCGGREEGLQYGQCCGPYHGGVVEPDATTLMSKILNPSIKFLKLFAMTIGGTLATPTSRRLRMEGGCQISQSPQHLDA